MMAVHKGNNILSSAAVQSEVNTTPHNGRVNTAPVAEGPAGGKKISAVMMPSTDIF